MQNMFENLQQAQLLQALPTESLLAPACGDGKLLLVCINDASLLWQPPPLPLFAQEADPNKWALTKIQLLLRHACVQQVKNGDYRTTPTAIVADIGVVSVPSRAYNW